MMWIDQIGPLTALLLAPLFILGLLALLGLLYLGTIVWDWLMMRLYGVPPVLPIPGSAPDDVDRV